MRPGAAVAAACLALLSCLRFVEQAYTGAVVLAALALGALALGLRRGGAPAAPDHVPSAAELHAEQVVQDRSRRGWRWIVLLGLTISVVGAVVFPPMGLVVAGLTLYSVHRMRQASRSMAVLGRATG
ncbi:MAG: hypothetical protein ACRDYU_05510 [Actinomycetes bacterium]